MRSVMRKPAFCICQNKGVDQLLGNRMADQHLYFYLSLSHDVAQLHRSASMMLS